MLKLEYAQSTNIAKGKIWCEYLNHPFEINIQADWTEAMEYRDALKRTVANFLGWKL